MDTIAPSFSDGAIAILIKNMNMRSSAMILIVMLLQVSSVHAQVTDSIPQPVEVFKKSATVRTYRGYMKDKNYQQALQTIEDAMAKHEEVARNSQFYKYKLEALNELIGEENRKIYLQTQSDTTTYFNYMYELYVTGLACDSIEQLEIQHRLEEGKKMSPKLRYGVGERMLFYRKNLLSAGKFYYKRKDYQNAFRFLDMYAQTKSADVFKDARGNSAIADPNDLQEVSVLALLSAYGSSNYRSVLDYLPESLGDKNLEPQLLEVGSKSAAELGDTLEMVRLLEQGFECFPAAEYFFITLTKYYNDRGEYGAALSKAVRMCELYPQNRDYWYTAGKEQMLLGRDSDALFSFAKCVELQPGDAASLAAIGNVYLHQAHVAYEHFNVPFSDPTYANRKAAITEYYKQACGAFEQARRADGTARDLWLAGLREVYFQLNKGRELRALERGK